MRCEVCGGEVVLDPRGYYVCSQCGLVVEISLDSTLAGREVVSRRRSHSEDFHLERLNLIITGQLEDYRLWRILSKVSSAFNLSPDARKRILEDYKRFTIFLSKQEDAGFRKTAILALLLYLESKRRNPLVNLRDFVKTLRAHGLKLRVRDVLHLLPFARQFGLIASEWDADLEGLMVNIADPGLREVAKRHAKLILSRIRRYAVGRSRRNVAAAVAVIVLRKLGVERDLYYFAKALRVPYSSLRSNIDFVTSLLLETGLEKYLG
ncbi:TFIIB-type zinc ribbon-containing protein [Infirmifilum sp. SLHALR2]|nr:MAG: hypothetical protein B7L53_04715 [Thermofilum sp. NZ13]